MDNFLIYLIQSFNCEALEYLFNKYFKLSRLWAIKLIRINGYNECEIDSLECDLINNLYRAIESYDSSKGVFYSYIKKAVQFTFKNYFREYLKFNNGNICSLDNEIEEDIAFIDVLSSDDNMSKIVERFYVLEEMETVINKVELFKNEEQIVIKLKMQGYSIDEISRMTEMNTRKVIYILSKIRKM